MKQLALLILISASVSCTKDVKQNTNTQLEEKNTTQKTQHNYGGWFCPDNLNKFPPVDINNWKNVPVINKRLPSKEETQNGTSLMYIDKEKYPTAKALDMELPQLATYLNSYTNKKEYVIVIQSIEIDGDSIVGFRFLNGGNGSARFNEVHFLTNNEIKNIPTSNFVSYSLRISTTQEKIWNVLTKKEFLSSLQPTFNINVISAPSWREKSNVNYYYAIPNELTSSYADKLFGCYYIQNDYLINDNSYVEKFLLLENNKEHHTELKIVCGPFQNNFEIQQTIIENWAKKVKELSEL